MLYLQFSGTKAENIFFSSILPAPWRADFQHHLTSCTHLTPPLKGSIIDRDSRSRESSLRPSGRPKRSRRLACWMGEPWKAKIPEPKIGKSPRLDVGRWTNKHAHDLDLGAGLIPVSVGQNLVAISFSASLSPKFDPYEDHTLSWITR